MSLPTRAPGVLTVGAALPDPPFELAGEPPSGLDIDLTRALAAELGLGWRLVRWTGANFNGIFAGLGRDYDVVASGATVTPARETVAVFGAPYLESGQALACDPARTPDLRSIDDLVGLVLGVQQGNTSEPLAEGLKAAGRLERVALYPYDAIETMLDDLAAGQIAAVMKLRPVLDWLVAERPGLKVVQTGITEERIAIAAAAGDLAGALAEAQERLETSGRLEEMRRRWRAA